MAAKKRVSRGGTGKGATGRVLSKRKTSPKASALKAQKGSLRAQSWVYAAINPLIDALESEAMWLGRGNPSWRERERRLEFIRSPREYLLQTGQIILEDFERFFPKEAQVLRAHTKHVEELTRRAEAAHDALLRQPEFEQRVRQLMEEYRRSERGDVWKDWSEEEVSIYVQDLVERLVNHVQKVSETWQDRKFWPAAEPELRKFCKVAEFRRLNEAVEACRADAVRLIEHLKDVRFRICDEYDIPAAPIGGIVASEHA